MVATFISLLLTLILGKTQLPTYDTVAWSPLQTAGDAIFDQRLVPAADRFPVPVVAEPKSVGVVVSAQSGMVIDASSGTVLWEKNSTTPRSIASITKLMTALVFVRHNPGWRTLVTIAANDNREGGKAFFVPGDTITVEDLFGATLVGSVNSGAVALERISGLTESEFVAEMNAQAAALGMTDSHFVEPTGLDNSNVATAADVAKLLRTAMAVPAIAQVVRQPQAIITLANGSRRAIASTDWLLDSFVNRPPYRIVGGKTGYTEQAGYCLTMAVENDGRQVYSVMLGSADLASRFNDTKGIIDWVFRNYKWD